MTSFVNNLYDKWRRKIPNEVINYFYHLPKAGLSVVWHKYPARKLTVIGVTGTSGKTTTSHLIYHILKQAGYPVSLISSIKAVIGDKEYDTGFHVTNPDSFALQKLLKDAISAGSKYMVLEITSHGLVQYRNLGTNLAIGVITNISHEHLDYHKSMKNYINAKARILSKVKYSVLNRDDRNFRILKNHYSGRLVTFGMKKKADFTPKSFPFRSKLFGLFNKYNSLAAIAVAKLLNVDDSTIRKALNSFLGIPGRMEEVGSGKKFKIFIDFAHKPNALLGVLTSSRNLVKGTGRLIVMFGAAGLRDHSKRPMMGEISGKLADFTVITAEDPRIEKLETIINQITRGAKRAGAIESKISNLRSKIKNNLESRFYLKIPDRRKAIRWIIRKLAKKGDVILFCGKGHEKSMCFGKKEYPWDERGEIEKALHQKGAG